MKGLKWKEKKKKKKKGLNDWINNKSKLKGLICILAKEEEKKRVKFRGRQFTVDLGLGTL